MERQISLLYVEDDPHAREMLEKFIRLKYPDLEVHIAADGEEGLRLYIERHPDLVVTDISMPGLDGFEMSRRIREVDGEALIIALTAHNDLAFHTKKDQLNFNQSIPKPVHLKVLMAALDAAIGQVRQRASLTPRS